MIAAIPTRSAASQEPAWVRRLLIATALAFITVVLLLPLGVVFVTAFSKGVHAYLGAVRDPETRAAVRLTLLAAAVAVPCNVGFGLAAAWAITRFRFPGKRALVTLIDLPLAVSPVIAGLVFVLLLGTRGVAGGFLAGHGITIIYAVPGILVVTTFVTVPYVARELIPALEARGPEQELAALTLGATAWQTFRRVTLPGLKWPLAYGAILCAARAVGEFGAVSVVSGHIRGQTTTVPLHVENLYDDFQYQAAFAVSTVLVGIALATLAVKSAVEWQLARRARERS